MKRNLTLLSLTFLLILNHAVAQRNFYLDGWKEKTYEVPVTATESILSTGSPVDATISINTSNVLAKVLPTHLGTNTTFRNGSDQLSRTHLYTNAGQGAMRFPAGSGSNKYFWDGNIPVDMEQVIDKTGLTIDVSGINGVNSNYMTPELFTQFISDAGSQATVVVNYFYARYGKTTEGTRAARVQQAADYAASFVYKMNTELGANIQNWEIGNECYGKWEEGYNVNGNIVTGKEYGEDFRVFAEAMKAVDASIKVGAVVEDSDGDWNRQCLPEIQDHADFLAVHNYFTTTGDAIPENVLASTGQMLSIYTTLEDCIAAYTNKARDYFPIAMTEYNSRGMHNTTMMNGLFIAQILGELIKSGYGMGTIWVSEWNWNATDLENKGFLARNDPDQVDYSPYPSYIPFQYFHRCFGDKMIEASSSDAEVHVYASTFTSGEIGLVIVNTSGTNKVLHLDMDNVLNGAQYDKIWWYDFYADNMDVGNKRFYINGQTGTTAGGGPDNFATIAPYQSAFSAANTIDSRKYSVQYVVLKANENSGALSFEDFENYAIDDAMVNDFWFTSNSLWERFWKGTYLTSYTSTIVDESINSGSQAMQLDINPLSVGDGGGDIKLRTRVMSEYGDGLYLVSYTARTDIAGDAKATLGADEIKGKRHTLTQNYQEYLDIVSLSSEKLFLYLNNSVFATGENYKIWVDDLRIALYDPTDTGNIINDSSVLDEVVIFPNPVENELHFKSKEVISRVTIFNSIGLPVLDKSGPLNKLNVSQLATGVYSIRIKVNNEFVISRLLKSKW